MLSTNLTMLETVMMVLGVGTYDGIRFRNLLVVTKRLMLVMSRTMFRVYWFGARRFRARRFRAGTIRAL